MTTKKSGLFPTQPSIKSTEKNTKYILLYPYSGENKQSEYKDNSYFSTLKPVTSWQKETNMNQPTQLSPSYIFTYITT
jgi:hypothetical protein